MAIMGVMGYRKRTGVLAGLSLAQISEFSLIFMAMALAIGHVDEQALGLVTLVGLITIAASMYMITYSHRIYPLLEPILGVFERKTLQPAENGEGDAAKRRHDVILLGLGRYGGAIAQRLIKNEISALGADFNPAAVRTWRDRGLDTIYGDLSDQEFISHLPLKGVQWVISTATDRETGVAHEDSRIAMIKTLRQLGFKGKIAVTSQHGTRIDELTEAGADLVLQPFQDAADRAVDLISGRSDLNIERLDPIEDAEEQRDIPG